jgi:Protein of unknown function (DUF2505)
MSADLDAEVIKKASDGASAREKIMQFTGTYAYDASLDAILDMLGNPEAVVAKYERMNQREVVVKQSDRRDGSLTVRSSRVLDVDLPGFARRILRPTNTVEQTDEWIRRDDGTWHGNFAVEIRSAPIRILGTMKLTPTEGRTVYDISASVDVHVPMIGRRLADWVADTEVRRSIEEESEFYDRWLKEHA